MVDKEGYTKEKWVVTKEGNVGLEAIEKPLALVLDCPEENANAQRIVDCVNGCQGYNPLAVKEVVEALRSISERYEHPCLGKLCRLYEGKPDARCFHEGFIGGCSPDLKARWQAIEQALANIKDTGD